MSALGPRAQRHLTLTTFYKKTHDDFRFVREFGNFERVRAHEPIAVVNGIALKAERDSHIIFPYANRPAGIEAFLLVGDYTPSR